MHTSEEARRVQGQRFQELWRDILVTGFVCWHFMGISSFYHWLFLHQAPKETCDAHMEKKALTDAGCLGRGRISVIDC